MGLNTNLFGSDGSLGGFPELLNHTGLAPQILLAADEDDGQTSAEMHDFRNPLETEDMCQRGARDMINNQRNAVKVRGTPGRRKPLHGPEAARNDPGEAMGGGPMRLDERETHLLLDVVERIRRVHSETDQNDVRVWV